MKVPWQVNWTRISWARKMGLLRRPVETALAAAIAVVNQPHALDRAPLMDGLFEGVQNEPGMG